MSDTKRIRVIAICAFRHEDSIFVAEGIDDVKQESFYRPLGDGEFGETGRDAIVREIALVYEGRFSDDSYCDSSWSVVGDEEGMAFKATWVPLEEFRERKKILYPVGLLELLDRRAGSFSETL
jgi:hypothetical protein